MDRIQEILLNEGKLLPLMEEFYSLQGEGFHTGKAAWFARIGGCDVGCHWCDSKESWQADKFPLVDANEVIRNAAACVAKSIVITGGEPLLYNLDYLCDGLHREGVSTFLETSGSSRLTGTWDWICLSPKKDAAPLPEILPLANELKVIIEDPDDFRWAEENARQVSTGCILFLQAEWSRRESIIPAIVDYIQHHPKWRISLQSHKYMRIP